VDSVPVSLSGLKDSCPCSEGQKSVRCEFVFEYETRSGMKQVEKRTINVQCTNSNETPTPRDSGKVVEPIVFGTLEHPWEINNCVELQNMNQHLDGNYVLGQDINCYNDTQLPNGALYNDGNGFEPIGKSSKMFVGSLNGQNHTISNLMINRSKTNNIGLFSYLAGTISDVGLENVSIIGKNLVGGLTGISFSGSISNSYSIGYISGYSMVGGLIGRSNNSLISNSYSNSDVNGNSNVGGLIGSSNGDTIDSSYSTGDINSVNQFVGGLVGFSSKGLISASFSTGNITGSNNYVGGLAGRSSALISNSYSTGDVNGSGDSVGGLLGAISKDDLSSDDSGSVINSYSTGSVSGFGNYIGGLVGISMGSISDSYATGDVNGFGNYVGGLVGYSSKGLVNKSYATGDVNGFSGYVGSLIGKTYYGSISNSFSIGKVISSGESIGGLIGENGNSIISNCYWDVYKTSQVNCCGSGACDDCFGKNSGNLESDAFFPKEALGWDYNVPMQRNANPENNWTFGDDGNWKARAGNYPILAWQQ
jgi:hypothetical protein